MQKFFSLFYFIFFPIFSSLTSYAEYRVYQYYVSSKNPTAEALPEIITSSLDPVSYLAYHGGTNAITIIPLRSWICPGYTGEKLEYCASPYKVIGPQVMPTSNQVTTNDKKNEI